MENNKKNMFEKPGKFLGSKITVSVAIVLLILITAWVISYFKDSIKDYLKNVAELILKTTTETLEFELTNPIIVILILFLTLFLSYYLLRSAHQSTGNPIKWRRGLSILGYWIGNIYVVILETTMYALVFLVGLTFTMTEERKSSESALEFLMIPTVLGIVLTILVYGIFSLLLRALFTHEYGGFLTIEELKWNRDLIDLVSTLLFIFAVLGSIITVVITDYKFTDNESKMLFLVFTFTITLYVLKMIKNFTIIYVESKIVKK